jgi:5-methylcytosine-specific restriction endonuclease McrA
MNLAFGVASEQGQDHSPQGKRAYHAAYYRERAEEFKAKARERYQAQKEVLAGRYRATRDAKLAAARERLASCGDSVRAAQRARYAEDSAPAIARANKRRAIQFAAALGTDRAAYRAKVKAIRAPELLACEWCHVDTTKANRRIDHVVPLSRGGADAADNLCCACFSCNARKGNKLPTEWAYA